MSDMVEFRRALPLRHDVDVFVAGGGPSGVAAAVAAARQGSSVFLAEGHTCLGGMGTAGLVPGFTNFTDGVNFLADGIGREVHDRHKAASGIPDRAPGEPYYFQDSIDAEALKRVYDDMLAASGAAFALETHVTAVEAEGGRITHAVCWGKSGHFAVRARVYVDCTGDGDLAAWAGAPFEKGDAEGRMMAGTLCSLWTGIDWPRVAAENEHQGDGVEQAIADGVFTHEDRHFSGVWRVGPGVGGANMSHAYGVDGTDERSLTAAMVESRRMMIEYRRYLKEYVKGFERAHLASTGSLMGIRETRRIMGDYVLCLDDFHKRASFADEIGRHSYPVDIHESTPGKADHEKFLSEWRTLRYGEGESYGLPYRSLLPRGLSNALVAGRSISADRSMQASVRVMPCCFTTGQAAGVAAALAAAGAADTRGVDVTELQSGLKALGAYLPNFKM